MLNLIFKTKSLLYMCQLTTNRGRPNVSVCNGWINIYTAHWYVSINEIWIQPAPAQPPMILFSKIVYYYYYYYYYYFGYLNPENVSCLKINKVDFRIVYSNTLVVTKTLLAARC